MSIVELGQAAGGGRLGRAGARRRTLLASTAMLAEENGHDLKLRWRPDESSNIQICGTIFGVLVRQTTGSPDLEVAKQVRAALELAFRVWKLECDRADLEGRARPLPPLKKYATARGPKPFAFIARAYRDHKQRRAEEIKGVNDLIDYVGEHTLGDEVDQAFLDEMAKQVMRPGAQETSTHRRIFTRAKAIRRFGAGRGWCSAPIYESKARGGRRTTWLVPHKVESLLGAMALPADRNVVEFAYATGGRREELFNFRVEDVDLHHRTAVFRDTKSNGSYRERTVALNPRAMAVLRRLLGRRRRGPVFCDADGQPLAASVDAFGTRLNAAIAAAATAAGLTEKVTLHVGRHSYATWFGHYHKDIQALMEDGDWADAGTALRYLHAANRYTGLAEDIARFWRLDTKSAQNPGGSPVTPCDSGLPCAA